MHNIFYEKKCSYKQNDTNFEVCIFNNESTEKMRRICQNASKSGLLLYSEVKSLFIFGFFSTLCKFSFGTLVIKQNIYLF